MPTQNILRRPLFTVCASFFLCSILISGIDSLIKMILICVFAVICILLFILKFACKRLSRLSVATLLILIPLLVSAIISVISFDLKIAKLSTYSGSTDNVTITIREVRYTSSYYGYYIADITGGDVIPDVTVSLGYTDGSCNVGDVLSGNVTFYSHKDSGTLENEPFLLADGILMTAEAEELHYVGHDNSFSLTEMFRRFNSSLSARIRTASKGKSTLACAVLLGDRSHLPDSVSRDFSRVGVSHLLAISGIHLSVIVALAEFLIEKARIQKGPRTAILSGVILSYMALVGFSSSVTRAGIMHLIKLTASLFNRDSDSLTSLAMAAALIVAINPCSAYDTSLILSVIATYSCIVYAEAIKGRPPVRGIPRRVLRYSADTVKLSLLITALTLPIVWNVFGEISVVSPLTNIIFIPLITVYICVSLAYMFICGIPGVSNVTTEILCGFERFITSIAGRISHLRGIVINLRQSGIVIFVLLLFASVLISTVIYKKHRKLCRTAVISSLVCLTVFILVNGIISSQTCSLDFVTKGKNEGFVLRNGNSYVLVDVSDGSTGFLRKLSHISKESGGTETDTLVLTHLHKKHSSAVASLADRTIIRKVVLPEPQSDDDTDICESIIKSCYERGIEVGMYSRSYGETCDIDGISFMPYEYTMLKRSTHPIVSFNMCVADRRYVYAGGSSNEGDEAITDDTFTADAVFFGAHPPIYKSEARVAVSRDAVFTYKVSSEPYLSDVIIGGNRVIMDEDGVYSVGNFHK